MTAAGSKTKKWISRLKNRINLRSGNSSRQNLQSVPIDSDPPTLQNTPRIALLSQRVASPDGTSLTSNPRQEESVITPLATNTPVPVDRDSPPVEPKTAGISLTSNSRQGESVVTPPTISTAPASVAKESRHVETDTETIAIDTTPNQLSASEIETLVIAHGFPKTSTPAPSTLYAALTWAVNSEIKSLITTLLSHGASILPNANDRDSKWAPDKWDSPLHSVIQGRDTQTAELLLTSFLQDGQDAHAKSSDVTRLMGLKDHNGKTPLALAAEKGQLQLVAKFLDMGADLEQSDGLGRTPLHQAARCGKITVVRFLLDRGAKINAQDNAGRTALDRAIAGRHYEVEHVLRKNIRSNLPFKDQAATGVHGMRSSGRAGHVATESKIVITEENTRPQGGDVDNIMPNEKRRSKQYRVEVTTVAVEQRETDAEDWDEPLPIIRYNALLLPSQDEVIPAKAEGDHRPVMNTDWDEPFQAVRYGVGSDKGISKPIIEASASTDSEQWDEPFSAVSYKFTRTSATPAHQALETSGGESSTPLDKPKTGPSDEDLWADHRVRSRAPRRWTPSDEPTSMDILRWD